MGNIIPPNTLIETSDSGVLAICDCPEQRSDDILYAHGRPGYDAHELVQITRDGTATNRYADGVAGVTEEDAQAAENDGEPFCSVCGDYIRGWLHTAGE